MWMPAPTVKAVLDQEDRVTAMDSPVELSTKNTDTNTNKVVQTSKTDGCVGIGSTGHIGISSCNHQNGEHPDLSPDTATTATTTTTTDVSVVSDHDLHNFLTEMCRPSLDVTPTPTTTTTTTTYKNNNNNNMSRGRGVVSQEETFFDGYDDEEEEEEELVFGPSIHSRRNYGFDGDDDDDDDEEDEDDDDLRSIVSFSSLSVDTFFSFDDYHRQQAGDHHNNNNTSQSSIATPTIKGSNNGHKQEDLLLPMISPGCESTSNGSACGDDCCFSCPSSSSSSPYAPSNLKARASVATGSATKLWNGLQIHMINKIPTIPNLLSHHGSSSHDSTTSSPSHNNGERQVQASATGTGDVQQQRNNNNNNNSSSDRTTSSITPNVVTETLQSWMNHRRSASSTAATSASASTSASETQDTSSSILQPDDDAFGLGDGLELPSASLHKVSNHSDTDLVVVDGNDDEDSSLNMSPTTLRDDLDDDVDDAQCQHRRYRQYGVTPKRQVTPPKLPQSEQHQQQQQPKRPFAFLSFESVDSSNSWAFRPVSPMPSWGVSSTVAAKEEEEEDHCEVVDGNHNHSDDVGIEDAVEADAIHAYNNTLEHTEDDLSMDSSECDDVLLHRETLNSGDMSLDFDDYASLGFDLFHPDDDLDLDCWGTETSSDEIDHRRDTQVMGEDEAAFTEGKECSYSSNDTGTDRQRRTGAGALDKFSRLQKSRAGIPRKCSVTSSDRNDVDDEGGGSVHSSWSSQEDESSDFVPTSNYASDSSTDTSQRDYVPPSGRRGTDVSTKPETGRRRRRRQSPAKSCGSKSNKKLKKQSTNTTNTAKRIRKEEPKVKEYVEPTDQDVLLGRGGRSNHHPGNKVYRERVLDLQAKYKTLSRDQKTAMSSSVVEWIQTKFGGNFLQFDVGGNSQDGPWYVVLDETARSKVSQALREDHTAEGRAAKLERRRNNKPKNTPKKHKMEGKTTQLSTPKSKSKKRDNNQEGTVPSRRRVDDNAPASVSKLHDGGGTLQMFPV